MWKCLGNSTATHTPVFLTSCEHVAKNRTVISTYLKKKLTSISIRLGPVTVLKPTAPSSFVFSPACCVAPNTVAPLESMAPLPFILPFTFCFNAKIVTFTIGPVTLVSVTAGPSVNPQNFETIIPGTGIFSLIARACAHALAVGFASFPTPAVSTPVIKVESSSAHRHVCDDRKWRNLHFKHWPRSYKGIHAPQRGSRNIWAQLTWAYKVIFAVE